MRGISWLDENQLDSQEGLCSKKWGQKITVFSEEVKLTLDPTQSPIQWMEGSFPRG